MNSDEYSRKQKARDAEYEREYLAWVESLSAEELHQLEAKASPPLPSLSMAMDRPMVTHPTAR
jgi:hypothetical protein